MKPFFYIIFFCVVACSTNEIPIAFEESLTVEGIITPNNYAKIYLTKSMPVVGTTDSLSLIDAIETTAKIELTNNGMSEILTLKKDERKYPFFYYRSNLLTGQYNESYALKITLQNKIYEAVTKIPSPPIVISNTFEETQKDSLRKLLLKLEKKKNKTQYFTCFIKHIKDKSYTKANPFIFNDSLITTPDYTVSFLYDKMVDDRLKNQMKIGDTIEYKLNAINLEEYLFWKSVVGDQTTINDEILFTQNTFTNISGPKVFGFWSGQNWYKESLIVK